MPGNALRSPLRNKSGRPAQPVRAARSIQRIGRQSLIERRDLCILQIARLSRDANADNSFLNKARQLLTKYWCSSSWRLRSDILRTAEWLVGIGVRNAGYDSSSDAGPTPLRS